MKFKKTSVLLFSLMVALFSMTIPAAAVSPTRMEQNNVGIITIFWTNTSAARANISVSGRTVKPSVYIKAQKSSADIEGTL